MRRENLTIVLLLIIAVALVAIAVQPILSPRTAEAQSSVYPFYIEPGSELLRKPDGTSQVYGKVVIDMRNGKIWGFPTLAPSPTRAMDCRTSHQPRAPSSWDGLPLKTLNNARARVRAT